MTFTDGHEPLRFSGGSVCSMLTGPRSPVQSLWALAEVFHVRCGGAGWGPLHEVVAPPAYLVSGPRYCSLLTVGSFASLLRVVAVVRSVLEVPAR